MAVKHPLIKSVTIASIFTAIVVILIPLFLLLGFSVPIFPEFGVSATVGIVLFGLGATISLACVKDFIFEGRGTPAPFDPPKKLVAKGFYTYVRNPMYLGLFLVILAEAIFFQSPALLMYLVGLILFFNAFVILYEEPKLTRTFGDSYRRYCQSVPRWLPTIKNCISKIKT